MSPLYALVAAAVPVLGVGFVHVRYSLNGTYVRWADEAADRTAGLAGKV